MNKLTEKQRQFVTNKAAGVTNRDAAIAAGYAVAGAAVAADKLMRNPAIRTAIKAATKCVGVATPGAEKNAMQRDSYDDPKTFLEDVMNHPHLPIAMRSDAAKQLLPYVHARLGETGKKEKAKENARQITAAGRNKFAPIKSPPNMHVIRGGKED